MNKQTRSKVLYGASWLGFMLTFPMWLLGWVDDRALLGITLALSWLALIIEARTAVHVDDKD